MRTIVVVLGAAGVLAAVAIAGGPNDLKGTLTCAGKSCTLKVTNNSGQPQSSLNIGVAGGMKVVSAKSAGTLEVTVQPTGGKPVTAHAGECAVTNNGAQVGCTYESNSWANGATKIVTLAAASAVAKGAGLNICPSNGGCRTVYFGPPPATTTSSSSAKGADLRVDVTGPAAAAAKGQLNRYVVSITNDGPEATDATATIESSKGWGMVRVDAVPGSIEKDCPFAGTTLLKCKPVHLAAHAKLLFKIAMAGLPRHVKVVSIRAEVTGSTKPDPEGNNHDSQQTRAP